MTKSTRRIPKLRLHKPSGRAVVTLPNRSDIYCGPWGSKEADTAYRTLMAEWLTGVDTRHNPDLTIIECIALYLEYLERAHATPKQLDRVRWAVKDLQELYGHDIAASFGPRKLSTTRQAALDRNEARNTINTRMNVIKAAFRHCSALEIIPPAVYHGLSSLPGLRREEVKAARRIPPVSDKHIEAVKPFVSASVWAAIEVILLTAARPSEILNLRPCDIDRSGNIWQATLTHHKNEHRDQPRVLFFGKRCQEILRPFIVLRKQEEYLFSPKDAFAERSQASEGHRRTNQPETPRQTDRTVGDKYDAHTFRRTIERACVSAGIEPWFPYQLRHTAATRIRKEYGVEAAASVLGHSSLRAIDFYSAVGQERSKRVLSEIG